MSQQLEVPHPVYGRYPPSHSRKTSDSSESTLYLGSDSTTDLKVNTSNLAGPDDVNMPRTPSPTQEEFNLLHAVCIAVFSKKIVKALNPESTWMRTHPVGPLIPIALFIIVSFPPLFGHEIIAMIVGITWDLWPAFAITAIGTILGEVVNFMVFKYACTTRMRKYEQKNLDFGLMAYIIRRGGLLMIVVIRFSAVPPHYATVVFSTVGISFWIFLLAAVISLPKQFVPVYTGYAMKPGVSGQKLTTVVEDVVIALGIIVTIVAYKWLQKESKAAREGYIYERRKARQARILAEGYDERVNIQHV
ncbi:hypothetical protein MIND_01304900 [Mycena indigotica]|uniref:Golgi apparatus membrane protein TVP38 n=1 Tax=Mycena indigotica TaxID=2126181 RepID=A0A8H6S0X0_9AGAR|nr:uncharacterized protein MIND_01304900 [Mycena indigotica]KAF7290646.1 hypothetical protein MIND_01304900 [Mycena indigotica]